MEESPVGESQSNGQAERAVGQFWTMKLAYEAAVKQPLPPDSAGMKWLVEFVACMILFICKTVC